MRDIEPQPEFTKAGDCGPNRAVYEMALMRIRRGLMRRFQRFS